MANLNRVLLIGNLTRDPELRYIPSGAAVTTFGMAVNRVYNTQSGEKKKDTCFIRIVVWGKTAENCGEYLSKGSPVFVEGRLNADENGGPRVWTGEDGIARASYELTAQTVKFLGGRPEGSSDEPWEPPGEEAEEEIPF